MSNEKSYQNLEDGPFLSVPYSIANYLNIEGKNSHILEAAPNGTGWDYPIIDVDGVRVLLKDGWGLIRASNTQPVLVLRFEAKSLERLEEIQAEIEGILNRIKKTF